MSLSLLHLQIALLGLNRPMGGCLEQSITDGTGRAPAGRKGSPENHRMGKGNNCPAASSTELPGAACASAGAGILQGCGNINVEIRARGLPSTGAVLSLPLK